MDQCLTINNLCLVVRHKGIIRNKILNHAVSVFCTQSEILVLDSKTKDSRAVFHIPAPGESNPSALAKVILSLEGGNELLLISDGSQTILLDIAECTDLSEKHNELDKLAKQINEFYSRITPDISAVGLRSSPVPIVIRPQSEVSPINANQYRHRASVPTPVPAFGIRLSGPSPNSKPLQIPGTSKAPYDGVLVAPPLDIARCSTSYDAIQLPNMSPKRSSIQLQVPSGVPNRDSGFGAPDIEENDYDEMDFGNSNWLHEDVSRDEAEEMLNDKLDGVFLIRKSQRTPFALTCAFKGKVLHFSIKQATDSQYELDAKGPYNKDEKFATLDEFVKHYRRMPIVCLKGKVILTESI